MEEKTQGLLLQSIPYLGGRRILKVLTAEGGLLSLIASRKTPPILTAPFLLAQWVYDKEPRREIYPLKDGSPIDDFSALKTSYPRLQAAGQMARDLLHTQLPGKPAAEPLVLATSCFAKLPLFENPLQLAAAFRLKLLACEGLLRSEELPPPLRSLAQSRSFQELAALPCSASDLQAAHRLFEESFG